ncbi:MAG: chemotaxis protein CheA [Planctomycetales bacterium]|nr:chemotaxis protein CheA [Planctomycetales bacterium]
MSRFRATFFEEAGEHLERMEASLLLIEDTPHDTELLNTIFRAAHSIKGASSTFGIDEVSRFTHVLENLLDRLREGQSVVTSELVELLLRSTDVLSGLLESEKSQGPAPENLEEVFQALHSYNERTAEGQPEGAPETAQPTAADVAAASGSRTIKLHFQPSRDFFRFGQNAVMLIEEIHRLGTVQGSHFEYANVPSFETLDPEACYLEWEFEIATDATDSDIAEIFMFLDESSKYSVTDAAPTADAVTEAAAAPTDGVDSTAATGSDTPTTPPAESNAPIGERRVGDRRVEDRRAEPSGGAAASGSHGKETVRVDRERLDKLINQIGELVIGTSMVEQEWIQRNFNSDSAALVQLGKIVRDLQEMSLSLRMIPVAATFQKMARVVRDLSRRLGKSVRFETEGEDTELDKTVVDQIGDPLLHMVRNSIDHGIESSEARIAAGKPAEGRIVLRAYHQGGNFMIEVEDDGRGLDRSLIVKRAIERGIIESDQNMTDEDVFGLIFAAGFSTAAEVTDVSGRGVGMDVVRRNVEELQGSIVVRSNPGEGCKITIRLPLTLAILDGLLVRLRDAIYVIPLLCVVESIRPQRGDIKRMLGLGEVVSLRGEVVPLLFLDRMLNPEGCHHEDDTTQLLVIIEEQGRKYAVVVDELIGQQQVVIKNLETNFQKVAGVAGATILGDGRVALILDVGGLTALPNRNRVSDPNSTMIIDAEETDTDSEPESEASDQELLEAIASQT